MEFINNSISYINSLPPTKKIILIIIFVVLIIFLLDGFTSILKYKNITNHSKEKMTNDSESLANIDENSNSSNSPSSSKSNGSYNGSSNGSSDSTNPAMIPYRDITINTDLLNITLFYADWCGHCKRFMGETWGKLKEKFGTNKDVQLNQIDCTNVKSAIETPAGKPIEGFPSVILNYKDKDGRYVEEEYNGPRSFDVMSSVIHKFTGGAN